MVSPVDGVRLRAATPQDAGAVRAVVAAAFGEHDGDEARSVLAVLDALHASGAVRAELVAETTALEPGGAPEVVGHVLLSRAWLDTRHRLVEGVTLSPLSVRPDHQGRGVGAALLAAAHAWTAQAGLPVVALEGDPAYYRHHGWVPGATRGIERPSTRIPEAAFQVRTTPAHESWMTGRWVYAEAFWATDTVGLRDPVLARVEEALAADAPPEREPTRFASVLVVDARGHVLLQERDEHAGIDPDRWGFVGGHVEPGESYAGAAVRELAEETGLTGLEALVEVGRHRVFHQHTGTHDEVALFTVRLDVTDADVTCREGRQIVFVDPADLPGLPLTASAHQLLPGFLASTAYADLTTPRG